MRRIGTQISILILVGLFFSPFLILAEHVDISVSATVSSSSTPPAEFCGDNACNNGETCSTCSQDCGNCIREWGTVIISGNNKVVFEGKAYPFAVLTILKNNAVISVFKAGETGLFEKEINAIPGGTYNFAIFAEDSEGRKSVTIGFTAGILEGRTTTISGIFIPPTIDVTPYQSSRGDKIDIAGQSFPKSDVNIFISPKNFFAGVKAFPSGVWLYKLDTSDFDDGEYQAKANAVDNDGSQSAFSQIVPFLIKKSVCRGADLNFDGKVDLVDFSILLYYWGQKNPKNSCVDINSDGIVNIVDFSIMMYWWSE